MDNVEGIAKAYCFLSDLHENTGKEIMYLLMHDGSFTRIDNEFKQVEPNFPNYGYINDLIGQGILVEVAYEQAD